MHLKHLPSTKSTIYFSKRHHKTTKMQILFIFTLHFDIFISILLLRMREIAMHACIMYVYVQCILHRQAAVILGALKPPPPFSNTRTIF